MARDQCRASVGGIACPPPTGREYSSNRAYFQAIFQAPCYIVALIITTLGCGVSHLLVKRSLFCPAIEQSDRWCNARPIGLIGGLSDSGIHLRFWNGPLAMFDWPPPHRAYQIFYMAKIFVPPCLFSWIITAL